MGIFSWFRSPGPEPVSSQEVQQVLPGMPAEHGSWEGHPCELPTTGIPSNAVTARGLVWRCPCMRRWCLVEAYYDVNLRRMVHQWQEVMSAGPVTDAEILSLLTGATDEEDGHGSA